VVITSPTSVVIETCPVLSIEPTPKLMPELPTEKSKMVPSLLTAISPEKTPSVGSVTVPAYTPAKAPAEPCKDFFAAETLAPLYVNEMVEGNIWPVSERPVNGDTPEKPRSSLPKLDRPHQIRQLGN